MPLLSPLYEVHQKLGAVFEEVAGAQVPAHFGDPPAEYRAARNGAAVIDVSLRTKIELTGADRAAFLHNLCTNEIKALEPGQGCEAFLTSAQGKILSHVYVFAAPESLVLDTTAGQAEALLAHLDRYLIREDVILTDRTEDWAELLLCGPRAQGFLESFGVTVLDAPLDHAEVTVEGVGCFLRRQDLAGEPSFAVVLPREDAETVWSALVDGGAVAAGHQVFETLRIEAGTPLYGIDVNEDNLPQEIARDAQTISFTKGCYIGQETVARIDSRGHVNRTLVGLKLSGEAVPEQGSKIVNQDKDVGTITSAAFSPTFNSPIALAYVRRGNEAVGTELEVHSGGSVLKGEVVALPFLEPS